jgi:hypothetical protein
MSSRGSIRTGDTTARDVSQRIAGDFTLAQLKALNASHRIDGQLAVVNGAVFRFDSSGTVGGVVPDVGTGRWYCMNVGHETFVNPAAPATSLGTTTDDASSAANPTGQPDVPQTLDVAFDANCDGTGVTVSGTGPDGQPVTETFATDAGETVAGTVVFATITATGGIVSSGDGTTTQGTITVQTSGKIGLARRKATVTKLTADGTQEAATQGAAGIEGGYLTPTTAKDGSTRYDVWYY